MCKFSLPKRVLNVQTPAELQRGSSCIRTQQHRVLPSGSSDQESQENHGLNTTEGSPRRMKPVFFPPFSFRSFTVSHANPNPTWAEFQQQLPRKPGCYEHPNASQRPPPTASSRFATSRGSSGEQKAKPQTGPPPRPQGTCPLGAGRVLYAEIRPAWRTNLPA